MEYLWPAAVGLALGAAACVRPLLTFLHLVGVQIRNGSQIANGIAEKLDDKSLDRLKNISSGTKDEKLRLRPPAFVLRLLLVLLGSFGIVGCAVAACYAFANLVSETAVPFSVVAFACGITGAWFLRFGYLARTVVQCRYTLPNPEAQHVWISLLLALAIEDEKDPRLDIVAGTLNPDLYGDRILQEALRWVKENTKVRVRLITCTPPEELHKDREKYARWRGVIAGLASRGLLEDVWVLHQRPTIEFAVSSRAVRMNAPHASWVARPPGTSVDSRVVLDAHSLVVRLRGDFDKMIAGATPATEVEVFADASSAN